MRNSVLIISHIAFWDCRVHIFPDNLSRNSCISYIKNESTEVFSFHTWQWQLVVKNRVLGTVFLRKSSKYSFTRLAQSFCVIWLFSLTLYFHLFFFTEDVEEQVCPVLLQLTAGESNDDYRSEAVAVSFCQWSHVCLSFTLPPLCPNIQMPILHTDLHTFP